MKGVEIRTGSVNKYIRKGSRKVLGEVKIKRRIKRRIRRWRTKFLYIIIYKVNVRSSFIVESYKR